MKIRVRLTHTPGHITGEWQLWRVVPKQYKGSFKSRDRAVQYAREKRWEIVDG